MNLFEYTYNLVRQIPSGHVSSYGAVAEALGDIVASRAVGRMMNQNPNADDMPCFRIVYSDGKLGGFGLGINDKIRRLENDNIEVRDGRIYDFKKVFFKDFKTDYPLKKLQSEQIEIGKKVITKNDFKDINTVAGIDVSYPKNEFEKACGAVVVLDYHNKQIVEEKTIHMTTDFPYIPTYFAHRELPIVKELIEMLDNKPTIILLDGNGILHPRKSGLASQVGVLYEIPTIGVAKNQLIGTFKDNFLTINNEKRGYAYCASNRIKKPIYISPGHKISLTSSIDIVKNLCNLKNPEPLRLAHNLAVKNLYKGI